METLHRTLYNALNKSSNYSCDTAFVKNSVSMSLKYYQKALPQMKLKFVQMQHEFCLFYVHQIYSTWRLEIIHR